MPDSSYNYEIPERGAQELCAFLDEFARGHLDVAQTHEDEGERERALHALTYQRLRTSADHIRRLCNFPVESHQVLEDSALTRLLLDFLTLAFKRHAEASTGEDQYYNQKMHEAFKASRDLLVEKLDKIREEANEAETKKFDA